MGRLQRKSVEIRAITKTYKINFRALTETEQLLLEILLKARNALLPWEIYAKTIRFLVDEASKKPVELGGHVRNMSGISQIGFNEKHLMADVVKSGGSYNEVHLERDKKRHGSIEAVAKHYREQDIPIPAFSTLLLILRDFKKSGMVSVRKLKSKEYYYLSDDVAEQLTKFLEAVKKG